MAKLTLVSIWIHGQRYSVFTQTPQATLNAMIKFLPRGTTFCVGG